MANDKAKGRQSNKKKGYYTQHYNITARNKTAAAAKRKRRIGIKQSRTKIGTCLGGDIMARDWNTTKQSRRKARNLQRRTRLLHTKAAAVLVLPVEEATAE